MERLLIESDSWTYSLLGQEPEIVEARGSTMSYESQSRRLGTQLYH